MQSRSDTDVDVFVLHGITAPPSPSPTAVTNSTKKISSIMPSSTVGTTMSTGKTQTSPTASDILSKLISDMPPPKHPKNFIVFAPVADTENIENHRKGRRFDHKVVVHDADDLEAEESMIAEDISQELGPEKLALMKKSLHVNSTHPLKPGMGRPPLKKINWKEKSKPNPLNLPSEPFSESPQNLLKRPHRGEFVTFPSNSKPPMNVISNRNGGITQPRLNGNLQQRSNFPNQHQNNKIGKQNFDKKKPGPERQGFRNPSNFDNGHPRNGNKNFQQSAPQQFPSQAPSQKFQGHQHITHTMLESSSNNQFLKDNKRPLQSPPNRGQIVNQQHQDTFSGHQQNSPPLQESPSTNQFLKDNQRTFLSHQNTGSNLNQQTTLQGPSQSNFPSLPQNSPEPSPMGGGGPQYFAPPPQTFHTKVNYDQPPSKFPSSSSAVSTYEKAAQNSVDPAPDGTHHHHHHHHHHEPIPSNSDPIGDVNYSDVPRASDTDRLGTIGIGMGPSRGITLQIGGGGGGGGGGLGGLGGLLPLGTLGIVRNIASALLPRPRLGLNSKVFLGVEVGRGGGLSVGLG